MNSYDSRQTKLMMEKIKSYEDGKISIGELLSDLKGLLDCLTNIENQWVKNIYSEWFTIEQVYSVALSRGGIQTVENGEKLIMNSLNKIKMMIRELSL